MGPGCLQNAGPTEAGGVILVSLEWVLYLVAAILLGLAAIGVRAGRVSLALLAATVLVFTYFVLPPLS